MDRINIKLKIPSGLAKEQANGYILECLDMLQAMLLETKGDMQNGRFIANDAELEYTHLREVR